MNSFRILDLEKQLTTMPLDLFEAEGFAVWVAEDVTVAESLEVIKKILLREDDCDTNIIDELKKAVEVAESSGRPVVVHASTAEGMRRAIQAGVSTIEHGDGGTPELFALMKEKGIALCPTLAAGDAVEQYNGWKKGLDPEPARIKKKREHFKEALASGVTICMGGDVGVFAHGDNAREMEVMVEYGMKPLDVLRSATSVNADVFRISRAVGRIRRGLLADLLVVEGNPLENISQVRKVKWVMKEGIIYYPDPPAH